jgi:hypothetical protein
MACLGRYDSPSVLYFLCYFLWPSKKSPALIMPGDSALHRAELLGEGID